MISRRSLLIGAMSLPVPPKASGASDVEKASILDINTLYSFQLGNGAPPQSFEDVFGKVQVGGESLKPWATTRRTIQSESAVFTDLRNGLQDHEPYDKLELTLLTLN